MNCFEFRREKLIDPRRLPEAARLHAAGCADCDAYARSVDESEVRIERGLAVPVPEGLADRVLLRRQGARRPAWRARALAAGVVAAIGAAAIALNPVAVDPYARLAIEHVQHEPESFTSVVHAEPESLDMALRSVGASVRESFGQVRYVKLCPLEGGGTGWHIVFDTPQGLATLIVVPNKLARAKTESSVEGWHALVQPIPMGYYAVVTSSAAATASIHELLGKRVKWSA